jgi:hypothetical protein
MNRKLEATIQKEIRRRAFEHADILRHKKQHLQRTQHTLDALQEVTGLPRPQLEEIAAEIKLSLQVTNEGFFSIKNQILMTFSISGLFLILSGCVYII